MSKEVVQFRDTFNSGEATSRHHERQKFLLFVGIGFDIRFFQCTDSFVPQPHRVTEVFERDGVFFHPLYLRKIKATSQANH